MANFDPLHSANNRDPSEYGGRAGLIQRKADGHLELYPIEKRMIIERESRASAGVMEDLPVDDAHADAVARLAAERKRIYASGHTLEEALE